MRYRLDKNVFIKILILLLFLIIDILSYIGYEDWNELTVFWLVLFILFFLVKGFG